ncbi:hypothetical protein [Flavivirga jejuensis]|uniref:Uncharacterized protein n=1 Tax=Flavivirga jejuensis TaxID=870487 RepID=A0ABT8WL31_9FLAO|nr:hypothetical protein [Flavivirga jejuensis]MDO5973862.1 hypothetical protein [Flavivirga jejuensis]
MEAYDRGNHKESKKYQCIHSYYKVYRKESDFTNNEPYCILYFEQQFEPEQEESDFEDDYWYEITIDGHKIIGHFTIKY